MRKKFSKYLIVLLGIVLMLAIIIPVAALGEETPEATSEIGAEAPETSSAASSVADATSASLEESSSFEIASGTSSSGPMLRTPVAQGVTEGCPGSIAGDVIAYVSTPNQYRDALASTTVTYIKLTANIQMAANYNISHARARLVVDGSNPNDPEGIERNFYVSHLGSRRYGQGTGTALSGITFQNMTHYSATYWGLFESWSKSDITFDNCYIEGNGVLYTDSTTKSLILKDTTVFLTMRKPTTEWGETLTGSVTGSYIGELMEGYANVIFYGENHVTKMAVEEGVADSSPDEMIWTKTGGRKVHIMPGAEVYITNQSFRSGDQDSSGFWYASGGKGSLIVDVGAKFEYNGNNHFYQNRTDFETIVRPGATFNLGIKCMARPQSSDRAIFTGTLDVQGAANVDGVDYPGGIFSYRARSNIYNPADKSLNLSSLTVGPGATFHAIAPEATNIPALLTINGKLTIDNPKSFVVHNGLGVLGTAKAITFGTASTVSITAHDYHMWKNNRNIPVFEGVDSEGNWMVGVDSVANPANDADWVRANTGTGSFTIAFNSGNQAGTYSVTNYDSASVLPIVMGNTSSPNNFTFNDKNIFILNMPSVEVSHYLVNADGTPDAMTDPTVVNTVSGVWGQQVAFVPSPDYLPDSVTAGKNYIVDVRATRAAAQNAGKTFGNDGSYVIHFGVDTEVSFYYAEDANGNNIPDYQETCIYVARQADNPTVPATYDLGRERIEDPNGLNGVPGSKVYENYIQVDEGSGEMGWYMLDSSRSRTALGSSSLINPSLTASAQLDSNGNPVSWTLAWTYGADERQAGEATLYYVRDNDRDGIPDHLQANVQIKWQKLDGDGVTMTGVADSGVLFNSNGEVGTTASANQSIVSVRDTNYVIDQVMTDQSLAAANATVFTGFTYGDPLIPTDGSVQVNYAAGGSHSITVYYALDANNNGVPDYLEEQVDVYFMKANADGTLPGGSGTKYTDSTGLYAGLTGEEGTLPVGTAPAPAVSSATTVFNQYEDASGQGENNYIYDRVRTEAQMATGFTYTRGTDSGLLPAASARGVGDSVGWTYDGDQSGRKITIYYALDADGDGTPDYLQESVEVKYQLVNGRGTPVGNATSFATPILLHGEESQPGSLAISDLLSGAYATNVSDTTALASYTYDRGKTSGASSAGFTYNMGASVSADTISFTFTGSTTSRSIVVYYAYDENGNGTPDHTEPHVDMKVFTFDGTTEAEQTSLSENYILGEAASTGSRTFDKSITIGASTYPKPAAGYRFGQQRLCTDRRREMGSVWRQQREVHGVHHRRRHPRNGRPVRLHGKHRPEPELSVRPRSDERSAGSQRQCEPFYLL